jgi:hypothetical protein
MLSWRSEAVRGLFGGGLKTAGSMSGDRARQPMDGIPPGILPGLAYDRIARDVDSQAIAPGTLSHAFCD